VELSTFDAATSGGFVINGAASSNESGYSVSSAGDVNGDGLADLIVGARYGGLNSTGRSYVVFGKTDFAAIDLNTLESGTGNGFVIKGESNSDNSGWSVSSAGDVNGDGLADLLVAAPVSDILCGLWQVKQQCNRPYSRGPRHWGLCYQRPVC
jgi:hypothetical protein